MIRKRYNDHYDRFEDQLKAKERYMRDYNDAKDKLQVCEPWLLVPFYGFYRFTVCIKENDEIYALMNSIKNLIQNAENEMQKSKTQVLVAFDDDRSLDEKSLRIGEDIVGATEQLFSELKNINEFLQLQFEGLSNFLLGLLLHF